MKKIGIMGGSFDPCHLGHVSLAEDARKQYLLDEVIFVPAKLQPFKMNLKTTPSYMRKEMVEIAIKNIEGFSVSDVELLRDEASFTYKTMRQLKEAYKRRGEEAEFFFILGTDAFLSVREWEKASEFLSENNFLVGSRPGYREEELDTYIQKMTDDFHNKIFKVENKKIDISSTQIRNLVEEGKDISAFVGREQEEYIKYNKLYQKEFKGKKRYFDCVEDTSIKEKIASVLNFIKENLSKKRVDHIMRVNHLAMKLGEIYGQDLEKIKLSVFCHDIAKEFKIYELNDLIHIYNLDNKYKNNPNLAHSKVGERIVNEFLGVEDKDILNAISFHTTGRANMSLLEKIVFISDFAEEGRSFTGVDKIRKLAYENIDESCYEALKHTLKYLKAKKSEIDEDSIKACFWFKRKVVENGN